jgi:hypothetical protein
MKVLENKYVKDISLRLLNALYIMLLSMLLVFLYMYNGFNPPQIAVAEHFWIRVIIGLGGPVAVIVALHKPSNGYGYLGAIGILGFVSAIFLPFIWLWGAWILTGDSDYPGIALPPAATFGAFAGLIVAIHSDIKDIIIERREKSRAEEERYNKMADDISKIPSCN